MRQQAVECRPRRRDRDLLLEDDVQQGRKPGRSLPQRRAAVSLVDARQVPVPAHERAHRTAQRGVVERRRHGFSPDTRTCANVAPGCTKVCQTMPSERSTRVVYSTGKGRLCPECAQPLTLCKCKRSVAARPAAPDDGIVRVGRETKGRAGKGVTVVQGLPLAGERVADVGHPAQEALRLAAAPCVMAGSKSRASIATRWSPSSCGSATARDAPAAERSGSARAAQQVHQRDRRLLAPAGRRLDRRGSGHGQRRRGHARHAGRRTRTSSRSTANPSRASRAGSTSRSTSRSASNARRTASVPRQHRRFRRALGTHISDRSARQGLGRADPAHERR